MSEKNYSGLMVGFVQEAVAQAILTIRNVRVRPEDVHVTELRLERRFRCLAAGYETRVPSTFNLHEKEACIRVYLMEKSLLEHNADLFFANIPNPRASA